mmetsp:Transcript_60368/g.142828  ORF Transcript_60368/g.142828 Transcript_60368/m.142828 type:complete len:173 (+) Transcript_60368:341-859(+)
MSNTAAWLIDMSELELERVLACGGMARVWLGKWRGLHVAIKQSTLFIDDDYLSEFCREATLMSEMRHPNILQFMGATLHASELFIITELCAHGSLFDVLHGDEIPPLSPHKMLEVPHTYTTPHIISPPPRVSSSMILSASTYHVLVSTCADMSRHCPRHELPPQSRQTHHPP